MATITLKSAASETQRVDVEAMPVKRVPLAQNLRARSAPLRSMLGSALGGRDCRRYKRHLLSLDVVSKQCYG